MAATQMYWVYESAIQQARERIREVEPRLIDVTGVKHARALMYLAELYTIMAWCHRRQLTATPAFPPIARKGRRAAARIEIPGADEDGLDAMPF